MNKTSTARFMLVTSMIIFGTIGLFVRNIQLPSAEIAMFRAIFAAILIGAYLLATKQNINLRHIKKELMLILLSGAAMGFNWIFLFEAYKYTTVSAATLSYYFAPVIVILLCPLLFGEKMRAKQWICFAMSTLGIILITGIGDISASTQHIAGILLGLCAALLYATVILLNKFIKNISGIHCTFLQFISAIVVLLPYTLATEGINVSTLNGKGWVLLLIVGVVHSGIAYCLYFSSLKELSGQEAAILSYIDPLVAVIMSVLVLGELMSVLQIVGGLLILGFTLRNEINVDKK